MNCWNENMMYHPEYKMGIGWNGREDMWDVKEDREIDFFQHPFTHDAHYTDPFIFGRMTHAAELIAEHDSQPNLTIDCIS